MHSSRRAFLGLTAVAAGLSGCLSGNETGDPADGSDGSGDGDAGDDDMEDGSDDAGEDGAENGDGSTGDDTGADSNDGSMDDGNGDDTDSDATVRLREVPDHGSVLVGPDEMTLYMFDSDEEGAGESTCYDGCASAWPPLTVDDGPTAGEGVTAELTTFEREDGSTQVAAAGWPLYYFAQDEEPGDVEGQGVNDVWWVLDGEGTPIRPDSGNDSDGGGMYAY